MLPKSLSFVDIETTGSSISYSKIIEIGILRIENNKLVKKFNTLVNPLTTVDPFIENLTGIKRNDLESAPTFYDLKEDLLEILKDSVFVAHNARFDYGILRNEFSRHDLSFSSKHFCTVKLSRLLYPGLKAYHLDSIIENFHIKCKRRHRAYDDAKVLWDFYKKTLKNIEKEKFVHAINIALRKPSVPLNISEDHLEKLPETSGVYIFYGENGEHLYIGKSINIKDRILSHFSSDYLSAAEMKISKTIKSIETIETAGELSALLLESSLIKKYQPLYNKKLRTARNLLAVQKISNKIGYHTIDIHTLKDISIDQLSQITGVFKSMKELKKTLSLLADEYFLCPKLLKLEKSKKFCFSYHLGKCRGACQGQESKLKYNLRFEEAFYKFKIKSWPFPGPIVIKEKGEKVAVTLIDKWCYLGNIAENKDILSLTNSKYTFDYDTYKILIRFIFKIKQSDKVSLSLADGHLYQRQPAKSQI